LNPQDHTNSFGDEPILLYSVWRRGVFDQETGFGPCQGFIISFVIRINNFGCHVGVISKEKEIDAIPAKLEEFAGHLFTKIRNNLGILTGCVPNWRDLGRNAVWHPYMVEITYSAGY
jgi:hypothetical protein